MRSEDLTRLAEADVDFHDLIYKATGTERLVQLLNNIREQMYRYRVEYLKDEEIRSSLIQEHNQLWQALKDRDEKKQPGSPRSISSGSRNTSWTYYGFRENKCIRRKQ